MRDNDTMRIVFLWHGLGNSEGTGGDILIKSFLDNRYHHFSCLVAFASHAGITRLTGHINKSKRHISNFNVIVGIDHKGTSREALQALLKLEIGTKIFHTTQNITFHPKIYIFEGDNTIHNYWLF